MASISCSVTLTISCFRAATPRRTGSSRSWSRWAEPQHQRAQSGWSLERVGGATALQCQGGAWSMWAEPQHQAAQSDEAVMLSYSPTTQRHSHTDTDTRAQQGLVCENPLPSVDSSCDRKNPQTGLPAPPPPVLPLEALWTLTLSCFGNAAACSAMATAKRAAEQRMAFMSYSVQLRLRPGHQQRQL